MFRSCKQLKGGKGTRYSSGCVDGTYAVIDGKDGKQGYLTGANYVVFDFNGKSSNKKYRSAINDDNRVDKPTRYFEPSGYKLEGWYKSAACKDNEKWNFDTDTVTSNITLYAKWVAATPANDEKKGSEQKNNDSKGEDGKVSFIPENYADIYLRSDANDLAINSKIHERKRGRNNMKKNYFKVYLSLMLMVVMMVAISVTAYAGTTSTKQVVMVKAASASKGKAVKLTWNKVDKATK